MRNCTIFPDMYLFIRKTALNTYTRLSPEWRKQLFVATLSLRPQTFVGVRGAAELLGDL